MPNIKFIRVKEKNDIETVVLLASAVWREHYAKILDVGQIEYMLDKYQSYAPIKRAIDGGESYFLIDYDGVPVGYVAIRPDGRRLFLDKLYVVKESRGLKIGRIAVDFVIDIAKNSGCNAVWLTVNKNNLHSVKAYKSYGFVTEGAVVTDIGGSYVMDDWQMFLYV